jgi:hypothetical protein
MVRDSVDWINLAHDRDQCQALVEMIMNYGVQKKRISRLAKKLLVSQNGPSSSSSSSWR